MSTSPINPAAQSSFIEAQPSTHTPINRNPHLSSTLESLEDTATASSSVTPEDQVRLIFKAKRYGSEIVTFDWEGKKFEIKVIRNAKTATVVFGSQAVKTPCIFACRTKVPEAFKAHLMKLIPKGHDCSLYFGSEWEGKSYFDAFESAEIRPLSSSFTTYVNM